MFNTELKLLLNNNIINHKLAILNLSTLKEAHIYCKINKISGQQSGSILENFIKEKNNMIKNKASDCNGDLFFNNNNYEIKISNGGITNKRFNYVQIRLNHTCNYIFTAYYICKENLHKNGELFIFKLTKDNVKTIILNHGNYAHGTILRNGIITLQDLNDTLNNKEYSIRTVYNDKCWRDLLSYRIKHFFV
jgi:hypothetical protein